jgi:hypothetical protein
MHLDLRDSGSRHGHVTRPPALMAKPLQHGLGNPRATCAGIWENTNEDRRKGAVERLPQ